MPGRCAAARRRHGLDRGRVAHDGYSGSDELAAYLFAVGTTWSLAHVLVTRGHVRIDALYRHLPLRTRAALDIVALLMLGILALAMLDCGFDLAWSNYVECWNRSNTPLRTPLSLPHLPWLFGLILFAASIAVALARSLTALARGVYHSANQIAGVASQDEEIESEPASMGIAKARTENSRRTPNMPVQSHGKADCCDEQPDCRE